MPCGATISVAMSRILVARIDSELVASTLKLTAPRSALVHRANGVFGTGTAERNLHDGVVIMLAQAQHTSKKVVHRTRLQLAHARIDGDTKANLPIGKVEIEAAD